MLPDTQRVKQHRDYENYYITSFAECLCNGENSANGNLCNQETGLCVGSCKDGFYGDECRSKQKIRMLIGIPGKERREG